MKKSAVFFASIALVLVFAGGISAPQFLGNDQLGSEEKAFDVAEQMEISLSEMTAQKTVENIESSKLILDDYEMPL